MPGVVQCMGAAAAVLSVGRALLATTTVALKPMRHRSWLTFAAADSGALRTRRWSAVWDLGRQEREVGA
jgi:hypothetical protein